VFVYILSTISEGLTAFDSLISTSCCSALDHIITFLFKQLTKKKRASPTNIENISQDITLIQVYQQQPQVFQQMLTNVLNIVIFEDCRNQWSMSRPLLGLILLNEQVNLKIDKPHSYSFLFILVYSNKSILNNGETI